MGNNNTKKQTTKDEKSSPPYTGKRVEATKQESPHTCGDLKENIKSCMKDDLTPVMVADDTEEGWKTFPELLDSNVCLMDCKILRDQTNNIGPGNFMQRKTPTQKAEGYIENMCSRLQTKIGKRPKLNIKEFQNWGQTVTADVLYCEPTSKKEIQKIIQAAADDKVTVRCVGSSHSWAPVICDDHQILMNLTNLQSDYGQGKKIRISKKARDEIDIMAGVKISDLKDFQLEHKLHLPVNVMADTFEVAGVVSVGAHGAGWDGKTISDYVVKMRIFDSKGQLRTYTTENGDVFRAARACFGCFGIIYDVTLKMESEILVETKNLYCNLNDVFYNAEKMKSLAEENWSTQIFWFPYNSVSLIDYEPKDDELYIRLINKAPSGVDREDWDFYFWRNSKDKVSQESLAAVSPLLADNPELTPYLSWASFKTLKYVLYPSGNLFQELPHAIHYRKHIKEAPVHDMEFIFDYGGDYEQVLKIIHVVVGKIDHYEEKDEYPLNLCLEMRFMAYSDTYLGSGALGNPANGGSGHVLCIEIISVVGTKGWEKFSTEIGQEWMALGGIPHLAKQWDYLPGIHQHIQEKMCSEMKSFKTELENSGADPNGLFLTEGLRKLLNIQE